MTPTDSSCRPIRRRRREPSWLPQKGSSSAQQGNCLEFAIGRRVMVRNSARPDREELSFPVSSWKLFVGFVESLEPPEADA
ncbi:DUF397 domain-containing protein [Streptomyces sp. SLBN-115]|uniref:DUF397 domain-containing protein n=1 Tax=Streptomyces sp. SLBN-115 TaxID=2768453 RepID=UPI001153B255